MKINCPSFAVPPVFFGYGKLSITKENRKSQAVFRCQACGHEENADINAAKNILTVGQTGMACQANRVGGRQQEPAGNREEILSRAS